MSTYKNLSGKSNVKEYEFGDTFIVVAFKTPGKDGSTTYKYTNTSAGQVNIEHMKKLAQDGIGLNTFINKEVKKKYESKW